MVTGKQNRSELQEMEDRVLGNVWAFLGAGKSLDEITSVFKVFIGVGVRALAQNDMSFSNISSDDMTQKWMKLVQPILECTEDMDVRKHLLLQMLNLISLHPCFNPEQ